MFAMGRLGKLGVIANAVRSLFSRAKSIARRYSSPLLAIEDDFLELGPELVVNGDFSNGTTGWVMAQPTSGSVGVVSGGMRINSVDGTFCYAQQDYVTVIGKQYLAEFDVSIVSGALGFGDSGSTTYLSMSSSGKKSVVFTAATGRIQFKRTGVCDVTIDNISVREILSAKVYQDSAGTLPATVGSPIGLLTDRSFGGELVSMNPPSTSSTTGWFSYLSTISSNGSALTVTNTSANEGYAYCLQGSILAGRTYEVDIEILSRTNNDYGTVQIGQTTTVLSVGRFTRTVTATNTHGMWVGVGGTTVGNQGTFILHSVRELRGNHATQSTAGNRPVLAQVPKRLGVERVVNGDGSSLTGWTTGGGLTSSIVSGAFSISRNGAIDPANAFKQALTGLTVGANYNVRFTNSGQSAACRVAGANRVDGYNFTFTATATTEPINFWPTNDGQTINIDNISVREVLEWTPAASFNGTTNRLQLATNPIGSNLRQPYTIIVAGVVGALGATRTMLANGGAVSWRITSTGKLGVLHNGTAGLDGSSTLSQGDAFVAEFVWDGSIATIRHNGAVVFSGALGVATINPAGALTIGMFSSSAYFNGQITGCAVFDRVLTDSERTTIGKAFAKELGVTYLG